MLTTVIRLRRTVIHVFAMLSVLAGLASSCLAQQPGSPPPGGPAGPPSIKDPKFDTLERQNREATLRSAELPAAVASFIDLRASAGEALQGASALLVGNESPEFRDLGWDALVASMKDPLVLDPGGFLETALGKHGKVRYVKVGRQIEA